MSRVSIVSWHRKFVQSAHEESKRRKEKKSLTKFNLELCAPVRSIRAGPCVVQLFRFVKTGFGSFQILRRDFSPTPNEFPSRDENRKKKYIFSLPHTLKSRTITIRFQTIKFPFIDLKNVYLVNHMHT